MSNKYSIFIYLLVLLIIFLVGGFKKKKPLKSVSGDEKEAGTPAAEDAVSPFGKIFTGTSLTDVLLDQKAEPEREDLSGDYFDEPDSSEKSAEEKMDQETFLPPEEEGISAFSTGKGNADKSDTENDERARGGKDHVNSQILDQQEGDETFLENMVEDFDAEKAIIYSEILDRKYF